MRDCFGCVRKTHFCMPSLGQADSDARTLGRICREAGATVRCNAKLRDMNVVVSASDERSIEVWVSGELSSPRSALTSCGSAILAQPGRMARFHQQRAIEIVECSGG